MSTLRVRGYLQVVRGQIYPTSRIARLASSMSPSAHVAEHVRPLLAGLRDKTGETAIAGTLVGQDFLRLAVVESVSAVRFVASSGSRVSAEACAGGLALLAATRKSRGDAGHHTVCSTVRRHGFDETEVKSMGICISLHGEMFGVEIAGPVERMQAGLARYLERLAIEFPHLSADAEREH